MTATVETDADLHIALYEKDGTVYQQVQGKTYRHDKDGLTEVAEDDLHGDWTGEDGYVSDDFDEEDAPELLGFITDDHNDYSSDL